MKDLFRIFTPVFLSLLLFTACGKSSGPGQTADVVLGNIIVGSVDWQDIRSGKGAVTKNAAFVAHLDLPMLGTRCTGFLINEKTIMTNHHCIPSSFYARGVTATFKYEKGVSTKSRKKFDCDVFLGNDRKLDYALLECRGLPGEQFGFAKLKKSAVAKNHSIYVIQQNCDYYLQRNCDHTKKISYGKVKKVEDEYAHDADTLGGSSGSPVFSRLSNSVIGLHHVGIGNNGFGRGVENYAVPMQKIVASIKEKFPSVALSLSGSSTSQDNSQSYEPNNSFSQAKQLASSKSVKGLAISTSSDYDFFKVRLTRTKTLKVKVSFSHSKGDLDLYLLNSSQKIVAKSTSVKDIEQVTKTLSAGSYYIVVLGYKGAKGKYDLKIQ